jgi:CheY-like chemotaxis protein
MLFPQTQLLLVDDSPLNLKILLEFLREPDYSLHHGARRRPGLGPCWKREPDRFHAVLLDRIMPEMDGMEVLRRMKQHTCA